VICPVIGVLGAPGAPRPVHQLWQVGNNHAASLGRGVDSEWGEAWKDGTVYVDNGISQSRLILWVG